MKTKSSSVKLFSFLLLFVPFAIYLWTTQNFAKSTVSSQFPIKLAPYYVVLSSDSNFAYLFPLPIVVLSWRRLGVDAIVILIGTRESYQSSASSRFVLQTLIDLKVRLYFMSTSLLDSFSLAQTIRMYASALDGLDLPDSTILITSDADFFVFHLNEHIPNVTAGEKMFLYDSMCCTSKFNRSAWSKTYYPHQQMIMSATIDVWLRMTRTRRNWLNSGDQIAQILYAEFNESVVRGIAGKQQRHSIKWSMDQLLLSRLINEYRFESETNAQSIGELRHHHGRIDRWEWPINFSEINLDEYSDSHFLHPMFGDNWLRMLPLLKLMFTNDSVLDWCGQYHKNFTTIINGTTIPLKISTS